VQKKKKEGKRVCKKTVKRQKARHDTATRMTEGGGGSPSGRCESSSRREKEAGNKRGGEEK